MSWGGFNIRINEAKPVLWHPIGGETEAQTHTSPPSDSGDGYRKCQEHFKEEVTTSGR